MVCNSSNASERKFGDGGNIPSSEKIQQVLHRLERLRTPDQIDSRDTLWSEIGKCGFRVSFDVIGIWQYLNPEQQRRVMLLLQPPQLQKDTVIGRFRIHFDTTNVNENEPALLDNNNERIPGTARAYVDSAGKYFNETWAFEIDTLGYLAPPFETSQLYYNIYILNLGSNLYGQIWWDPNQPINPGQRPPRFTTYIEIHNDFQPFFSQGMKGLKVTAAHEFHHAIQIGSYGYWERDRYFYELTSTWMEDVVYDDINDYYQYIKTFSGLPRGHFATPYRSLNATGNLIEYSRAIWGKFIEKRFHPSVMRRTWELMRQQTSLPALNGALNEHQSSLREAYNEFSLWNYFSGGRADTVSFYKEGSHYPEIRLQDTLQFQRPLSVFSPVPGLESLGSAYYILYLNARRTISVAPIVVKSNISEAGNGVSERFQYIIRSDGGDDSFTRFQISDSVYWTKIGGVNNPTDWTVIHAGLKVTTSSVVVYPNPFYAGQHSWIRFEVPDSPVKTGTLYIFTSSMELTYASEQTLRSTPLRPPFFTWDGQSNNGEKASSGIYFYVLEIENQQYTGKFALIRK